MKLLNAKPIATRTGFSLIEVLMVVAVMSSITAGVVFTMTNVTQAAENTKLQRDVNVVNTAIRTYILSGGSFLQSDLQSPATLLAKLKKRASERNAKEIAGLRGSMADDRLTFEMQTSADAREGAERARFIADPRNPRFIIQRSGPPGIRRFVLDSSLATTDFGTETRKTTLGLAKSDPWVWDYADQAAVHTRPRLPPPRDPTVVNPNPPDIGSAVLNAPEFSIPSSKAPLHVYPRKLALVPTNPAGISQIVFSINGAPFVPYTGPINVDPGMTVTGISVSLDLDRYEDSPSANCTYSTTPVTPWAGMIFAQASYNYFELGGEAAPGTPPPLPSSSVNGTGVLLNSILIPAIYQNSSVFRFVWTTDGSDPLVSATAQRQSDFRGGFLTTAIPVPLNAFGSAPTLTVRSAVKAENTAIVTDSSILTHTLDVAVLPLRAPVLAMDGRDVSLTLSVNSRDTPRDTRIFYTLDGTDPGSDSAGNPLRGTLYTGTPFTLQGLMGSSITIRARAYAPVRYLQFFSVSPLRSSSVVLPASTDVYVGGNFINPGGNPMRNIARLSNSGQVDMRFDTGRGASDDSLIGIVRQTGSGIVAGGDFETMDGSARQGLVRLKDDGTVDASFDADLSAN
jgi:prepilin-type N-terminal cleavage/methylation domain-containing protein